MKAICLLALLASADDPQNYGGIWRTRDRFENHYVFYRFVQTGGFISGELLDGGTNVFKVNGSGRRFGGGIWLWPYDAGRRSRVGQRGWFPYELEFSEDGNSVTATWHGKKWRYEGERPVWIDQPDDYTHTYVRMNLIRRVEPAQLVYLKVGDEFVVKIIGEGFSIGATGASRIQAGDVTFTPVGPRAEARRGAMRVGSVKVLGDTEIEVKGTFPKSAEETIGRFSVQVRDTWPVGGRDPELEVVDGTLQIVDPPEYCLVEKEAKFHARLHEKAEAKSGKFSWRTQPPVAGSFDPAESEDKIREHRTKFKAGIDPADAEIEVRFREGDKEIKRTTRLKVWDARALEGSPPVLFHHSHLRDGQEAVFRFECLPDRAAGAAFVEGGHVEILRHEPEGGTLSVRRIAFTNEGGVGGIRLEDLREHLTLTPHELRWDGVVAGTRLHYEPAVAGDYTIALTLRKGEHEKKVEFRVKVVRFEIVARGDHIVPVSAKNVFRYRWIPEPYRPENLRLEVYGTGGAKLREVANLPTTRVEGKKYAQLEWNGRKGEGWGSAPLTEAEGPYRLRLVAKHRDLEGFTEIEGARVREWKLRMTIPDREAFPGLGASGVDEKTVEPEHVIVSVQATDGPERRASRFDLERVDDTDVRVTFKSGDAEYLLVYACPTPFAEDPVPIEYLLDLRATEKAALDRAGNEWDLDPDREGRQDRARYRFRVTDRGAFDPDPPKVEP